MGLFGELLLILSVVQKNGLGSTTEWWSRVYSKQGSKCAHVLTKGMEMPSVA